MVVLALVASLWGCGRGCHGSTQRAREVLAPLPMGGTDCPDGLARCEEGTVSVSKLDTLPLPCDPTARRCTCPWERAGEPCERGCAASGVEVAIDASRARAQLCAPAADAGVWALGAGPLAEAAVCDEGVRYRCARSLVLDCARGTAVATCAHGCVSDTMAIDEDGVDPRSAAAILCSR